MILQYFYKDQVDEFTFVRIPKRMLTENDFSEISLQAKILYGLFLDRLSMVEKNRWIDASGKVYIIYPLMDIEEDLNISKHKAVGCLAELEKAGLIEKKNRGGGKPSLLYVKSLERESA
ncbi:MAG: replication initiator protein A [Lachnospiraceae bacterium]|nr:replication initiator protein A [Lachnospiraceae bacterium]MEE3462299.1 replication initiator protein A [Lachnospiraceae bacterium]